MDAHGFEHVGEENYHVQIEVVREGERKMPIAVGTDTKAGAVIVNEPDKGD